MKTLTCSDLGGPSDCQAPVSGNSFDELGKNCQAHVKDMMEQRDEAHLAAVEKMKNTPPAEQQAMFADYQKKFDEAPES